MLPELADWLFAPPGCIREASLFYVHIGNKGYHCRLIERDSQPEFIQQPTVVAYIGPKPDLSMAIRLALAIFYKKKGES